MKELKLNITPLNSWFPDAKPLIISGPCGAETREQVLQTALEIDKLNAVHIFRAGIWKPRTRPNSFEGVGAIGLPWLNEVQQQTKLKVAVEVANASHVEQSLKAGIDILWIGARTTANPFSVQEIADALKGVDIPILVKNPVNPDLYGWVGALERINQAGITKLAAVHRGFSSANNNNYRNQPQWNIPINLKLLCPDLPILCDPSHICGRTDLLAEVAQKALDLDFAGLMIESHINPAEAWSDAKQQVTPAVLGEMLACLIKRSKNSGNKEFKTKLQELRAIIDEVDYDLLKMLVARFEVIDKIGEYKKENNVTILQIERWRQILKTRKTEALSMGLSEEFITALLDLIHNESIRLQTEIMNKEEA